MVSKKRVIKYLEKIIGSIVISQMQKIALLVTVHILQTVLSIAWLRLVISPRCFVYTQM